MGRNSFQLSSELLRTSTFSSLHNAWHINKYWICRYPHILIFWFTMGQFVHNFLEQELFSRAFSFILLINCDLHENATKKKRKSLPADQGSNMEACHQSRASIGGREGKTSRKILENTKNTNLVPDSIVGCKVVLPTRWWNPKPWN